jgi:hypothetical protein
MLLQAIGYPGNARFVGLYFGAGDESYADDGRLSMTCDPHAYLAFVRHPACLELAGHDLGSSDGDAAEWLVVDRQESRAYLAPVAEARRFLREQHQESAPAGPVVLSEDEWHALMDRLRQEMESRPFPTPEQIGAALAEQHRLHQELVAWLDGTPQAAAGREAIRRMVEGGDAGEEKR